MNPEIVQTLVVAASLAGAALYLGRRALATAGVGRRGKKDDCGGGCGGGCG